MGKPECFYTPHLKLARPFAIWPTSSGSYFHPALLWLKKNMLFTNPSYVSDDIKALLSPQHKSKIEDAVTSIIVTIQRSSAEFQRMMTLADASCVYFLLVGTINTPSLVSLRRHMNVEPHLCTTPRQSDEMWSCDVVTLPIQCPQTGRVTFSNLCCLDSIPQEPQTVIGQAGTSSVCVCLSHTHSQTYKHTHTEKLSF